jgi:hypothetical protein
MRVFLLEKEAVPYSSVFLTGATAFQGSVNFYSVPNEEFVKYSELVLS